MTEITRAQTLHQGQFTRIIKITHATSLLSHQEHRSQTQT
ncbi:hypothetical protein AVHM3334_16895 [Acidovorax sp. SUPP3334]|nr:hypothetical protein AVHM3334_16895 [Acidovorax sp. SUPP3334]